MSRFRQTTSDNIAYYTRQGRRAIEFRLEELDAEWDIERVLEVNASSVSLLGLTLGATLDKTLVLFACRGISFSASTRSAGLVSTTRNLSAARCQDRFGIERERQALRSELHNRF